MQKFYLFLFSSFLLWIDTIYADNNLSGPNFTVSLSNLSPIPLNPSLKGGVGALTDLITNVTNLILYLIPIIAGVSLLIAGYFYIFSAGDSEKANRAKTIIKWNIVAILVALLSWGIIKIVASFLFP